MTHDSISYIMEGVYPRPVSCVYVAQDRLIPRLTGLGMRLIMGRAL